MTKKAGESKSAKQIAIELLPFMILGIIIAKAVHVYNMGGDDKLTFFITNTDYIISPMYWFDFRELLIGIGISIVLRFIFMVMAPPKKKFKHGQEYGSARWGA